MPRLNITLLMIVNGSAILMRLFLGGTTSILRTCQMSLVRWSRLAMDETYASRNLSKSLCEVFEGKPFCER